MKKEKFKIIIDGVFVLSIFISVTFVYLSNTSVEVFNKKDPKYMKFDTPMEEEYLEDEELQDYYLEDEDSQENKEKEDFHNEYIKDNY